MALRIRSGNVKPGLRRTRGFTFVELMVVLTIIVVLITMAIPIYNKTILRSKEAVLRQNLFTLRSVIDNYTYDKMKALQVLGGFHLVVSVIVDDGTQRKQVLPQHGFLGPEDGLVVNRNGHGDQDHDDREDHHQLDESESPCAAQARFHVTTPNTQCHPTLFPWSYYKCRKRSGRPNSWTWNRPGRSAAPIRSFR